MRCVKGPRWRPPEAFLHPRQSLQQLRPRVQRPRSLLRPQVPAAIPCAQPAEASESASESAYTVHGDGGSETAMAGRGCGRGDRARNCAGGMSVLWRPDCSRVHAAKIHAAHPVIPRAGCGCDCVSRRPLHGSALGGGLRRPVLGPPRVPRVRHPTRSPRPPAFPDRPELGGPDTGAGRRRSP